MHSYWHPDVPLLEEACPNHLPPICDPKDALNLRQAPSGSEKVVPNLCMKEMKLSLWGNLLYEAEFPHNTVLGCCLGKGKEAEE